MTILFCNIGWMNQYIGTIGDKISHGGKHVEQYDWGNEVFNFLNDNGRVYGYVQTKGKVNLSRLGQVENGTVSGVTVVWTALKDGVGTVIVGWYKNAIVHRYYLHAEASTAAELNSGNDKRAYIIEADARDAICLPADERVTRLPRRVKGGMGQNNIWYGSSDLALPFAKAVETYIDHEEFPREWCPASSEFLSNPREIEHDHEATFRFYQGVNSDT